MIAVVTEGEELGVVISDNNRCNLESWIRRPSRDVPHDVSPDLVP
jgi:hypothetical protein